MADWSGPHAQFLVQFASDLDGDQWVIVDERGVDLSGWRIECGAHDGRSYTSGFERRTWWLIDQSWNGEGYGEPKKPWSALYDHGDQIVRWIPPSPDSTDR